MHRAACAGGPGSFRGGAQNAVQHLETIFHDHRWSDGSSVGSRGHFSGSRRSRAHGACQQCTCHRRIPDLVPGSDRSRLGVLQPVDAIRTRRRMVPSCGGRHRRPRNLSDHLRGRALLLRGRRRLDACNWRQGPLPGRGRGSVRDRGAAGRPDGLLAHPRSHDGRSDDGNVPVHPPVRRRIDRRRRGRSAWHLLH